jgi:hypothetical protein
VSIEVLPSAPDVIALRVEGRIEHEALQRVIDRFEESLLQHEKTHVFVEAMRFSGLDFSHLLDYAKRAMPMLGRLHRFGRIAVVSDQAWLRAAARLESALLPNVAYEIFDSSERAQALAWVEGRSPHAHGFGIRMIETGQAAVLAFEVDGELTRDALAAFAEQFAARQAVQAPRRVIGLIDRMSGTEPAGLFDGELWRSKLAALSSVERYALVGGPAWLAGWVSVADALAKADIRHFQDEAAAWDWIGATPASGRNSPGA